MTMADRDDVIREMSDTYNRSRASQHSTYIDAMLSALACAEELGWKLQDDTAITEADAAAYQRGVEAERAACAKIAEDEYEDGTMGNKAGIRIAAAIEARSRKQEGGGA